MTMTRALDELDGAGLGTIAMEGRERVLRFNQDKRQVWETALERLRSPVKKRVWVKTFFNKPFGVKAGLSALAHYSNLAGPVNPVLALDGRHYQALIYTWKDITYKDPLHTGDFADNYNTPGLGAWVVSPTPTSPVPEPATLLLFGIGLLSLAGVNRRKNSFKNTQSTDEGRTLNIFRPFSELYTSHPASTHPIHLETYCPMRTESAPCL